MSDASDKLKRYKSLEGICDIRLPSFACDMPAARYIRFADVSVLRAMDAGIYGAYFRRTFAKGEHIAISHSEIISLFAKQTISRAEGAYRVSEANETMR